MERKTRKLIKRLTLNRGRKSYIEIAKKTLFPFKRKVKGTDLFYEVLERWFDFEVSTSEVSLPDLIDLHISEWNRAKGTINEKHLYFILFYLNDMANPKEMWI